MAKSKYNFHKINRRIHLYAGLFMIPYIFIFALSGIMFNHTSFMGHGRSEERFRLEGDDKLDDLFPYIESLAKTVADSVKTQQDIINDFKLDNIRYENTMILRSTNKNADHRIQIDIPTNNVQIMTLPDFVENNTIGNGSIETYHKIDTSELLAKTEGIIAKRGIDSVSSRVQRLPNVEFDLITDQSSYRVSYSLQSGNYWLMDLNQRKFKWNYFFTNLHQLHGYPLSGFSLKWLFVLFADSLAVLMMVWAVSGLIMWYKMKKQFVIGSALLVVSAAIALAIIISHYELGY